MFFSSYPDSDLADEGLRMRTMIPDSPETPEVSHDESDETGSRGSRRSFVFLGALAAAALLPKRARAQGRRIKRPNGAGASTGPEIVPNQTVAAFAEWDSGTSRLVRRVTQGMTPAELQRASTMGWQEYLNYQLEYTRIDDSALEAAVASRYPLMSQTSDVLFSADSGTVQNQLIESTIYRAAFSQRQLYQRMVEFWTDHFNQAIDKVGYLLVADQRDVIRAHALGKFVDLLQASAHSPSMITYLDQNTSNSRAPNQNYAREVMELHTVGVNGGYTQTDVAELSRVLTGWTTTGKGDFVFNPAIHDWGQKTVMGLTIPAGSPSLGAAGIKEGETIFNFLGTHPSTATFISTKLLQWFLTPTPTTAQVAAIASVFRATGGDMMQVVRAILNDVWLPTAPMKYKRPFQFLVSSIRSANPTVTTTSFFNSQMTVLGQPLFQWETPDGFPDTIEYWAGNIVPRWAYGVSMAAQNSTSSVKFDTTPYLAGSPAAAIDLINTNFFGGEIPTSTQTLLTNYLTGGTFNDARMRETIELAISANAFQWY
jgi:uncharacterized protein (DUF1800 family)